VFPAEPSLHAADSQLTSYCLQIIAAYPDVYRPTALEYLGTGGGFSGACIWKVLSAAGAYAVRAWPEQALPWDRLCGLHRLLRHIHQQGVTEVAVPLAARDGQTLLPLAKRFWQLEPWKPGTADFARQPTANRLRSAVTCLARWHQAAATFVPRAGQQVWFCTAAAAPSAGIADRIDQIDSWTSSRLDQVRVGLGHSNWPEFCQIGERIVQLFPKAALLIRKELEPARGLAVRLQPCLRDVWHDHVLFSGDEVTGLIDPGSCRTENVAADLARLLGSLLGDDRVRRAFAVDVYREFHPLTLDELALIELFDRGNVLLSGMTWLDWHLLQGRQFSNRASVIARLTQILGRLERLAAG
jgi:homoserine kinase type II